jgi:putative ABC transport system permease protein
MRAALGASRADLVRESLLESLMIGAAGAAAGLLVARVVLEATLAALPAGTLISTMNAVDLDARALAFTVATGLVTALLFGLAPALLASRTGVAAMLTRDSRSAAGSRTANRLRGALVIGEVALAMVLLVGAALMARTFANLQSLDRGFDTAGLVTLRVGLPAASYADHAERDRFTERMIDRARRLPGVSMATAGSVPPEASQVGLGRLELADRPGEWTEDLMVPGYHVWPDYFGAIGLALTAGRAFTDDEPEASLIVSASFARKYWPEGAALGAQLRFEGARSWKTIVGVATEVRQMELDDAHGSFEFYYPLRRPHAPAAPAGRADAIAEYRTIVARAADPRATLDRLRASVRDVDPRAVVWKAQSVEASYADAVARPRVLLLLLGVFAGLGLVLAAAGLYGVLSYAVSQRRREIGIRLALGARPRSVGRRILHGGLALTAAGLLLGAGAALALVGVMRSLLYDVEPTDPMSVVLVSAMLLGVAALACWCPARQAMRTDPVHLLREH